ncbi:MAG: hypothetical protein QF437_04795 [Planctomycetota bacterium]|nr:hypothetical protein [Planctomycetota bacterium]MDP7248034.1 hypothetical protein [Planctomycetota bacterium]
MWAWRVGVVGAAGVEGILDAGCWMLVVPVLLGQRMWKGCWMPVVVPVLLGLRVWKARQKRSTFNVQRSTLFPRHHNTTGITSTSIEHPSK